MLIISNWNALLFQFSAGKDLISSLVSGLMTIGPRFGGALDGE